MTEVTPAERANGRPSIRPRCRADLRVAVVGGGMAGLTTAAALRRHGLEVTVFDKGRKPGGRLCTRRVDDQGHTIAFDHGAQYFTAQSRNFRRCVEALQREGAVAPWTGRLVHVSAQGAKDIEPGGQPTRLVGVPSMSAVPRVLARGLDIVAGTRIVGTAREEGTWRLRDDSGRTHGPFAVLLLATPAAQAQALLEGASERLRSAATVSMHPSWALMVLVDAGATIDHDAAFVADSPLRWVMRQASKPGRSSPFDGWVLHATPQWSAAHFETPTEHVHAALLEAWAQRGGPSASRVRVVSSHRWRYALADSQPGDAAVYDTAEGLGLAGDWLGGARVEGAFLSGRALAARVLWQTRAAQDD